MPGPIPISVVFFAVLACLLALVWLATKQPPRTPEIDRRLDLVDRISKAAALLVQANFTHDPTAAHELERDCAGMLREVLDELHERPWPTTETAMRQRLAEYGFTEADLECQRLLSPEVAT